MKAIGWMAVAVAAGGWQALMGVGTAGAHPGDPVVAARQAALDVPVFPEDLEGPGAEKRAGESGVAAVTEWTTAVTPKVLSNTVSKGLAWLAAAQNEDGGWGQGEVSQSLVRSGEHGEASNVADTCAAALALIRSGACPGGTHANRVRRAAAFVCAQVEAADDESLWITEVRGTRLQSKIGTYVDTFLASLFLSEVKVCLGGDELEERVTAALAKVLGKLERNQQQGGGFANQGWAPVLAQSIGAKGVYRAAQAGMAVSAEFRADNDAYFAKASRAPAAGAAGVSLYSFAAGLGALQDSVNTGVAEEAELRDQATSGDEAEREQARDRLEQIETSRKEHASLQEQVVGRLEDERFVAGFGSNGGEEFLSYMNISESLVVNADDVWRRWDAAMADNLGRVQNEDGSWSGQHCITGRTFCTSAALLTLMADRTPVPVEVVARER